MLDFVRLVFALFVCVFFPFMLDIKFVGRTSRGHTGGRSHTIYHPPFCGARLNFYIFCTTTSSSSRLYTISTAPFVLFSFSRDKYTVEKRAIKNSAHCLKKIRTAPRPFFICSTCRRKRGHRGNRGDNYLRPNFLYDEGDGGNHGWQGYHRP